MVLERALAQSRNADQLINRLTALLGSTEGIEDFKVLNHTVGLLKLLGDQAELRLAGESNAEYDFSKREKKAEAERRDKESGPILIYASAEAFEYEVLRDLLPVMDEIARECNATVPLHTKSIYHSDVYVPARWLLSVIYDVFE